MANVLVISPLSSHQPHSGARRRIYSTLKFLQKQGHKVHFVYTACEDVDTRKCVEFMRADWDSVDVFVTGTKFDKSCGEDFGVDDWINAEALAAIPELAAKYSITHCLTNYVFQSKYLEALPKGVLKLLDCHDRLSRRKLYEKLGVEPGFFYTSEQEELSGLQRADIVLAIQDEEADYFQKSGRPVVIVGHSEVTQFAERRFSRLKKVGYLGAHNKFNVASLEAFIPVFSEYASGLAEPLQLSVAGGISLYFKQKPDYRLPHIEYEGRVADVGEYLASVDLFVNPTFSGTGLKIKSVEAMSYGLPIVSSRIGWDGLLPHPGFHDAEDPAQLIEAIERVREGGFGALTSLSNFSKASFSEYQYNLRDNLATLFGTDAKKSKAWAKRSPHYLGCRSPLNKDYKTLEQLDDVSSRRRSVVIAHVVNPVRMPRTSDLYIAEPIAFRSMLRAKKATSKARVLLIGKTYPEDADYLAECFDKNLTLRQSARDLSGLDKARKLPLVREVFSTEGLPSKVSHVVYTNSDIGLQPYFYDFIADVFEGGADAVVINRRTISKNHVFSEEMRRVYSDPGLKHPGFDCFAVRREILEQCDFGDTLVGAHLIGRVVFWNLLAQAKRIEYFDDHHCTFHIGDDVPSKDRSGQQYITHNLKEGLKLAEALRKKPGYLSDPARQRKFGRVLNVSPGDMSGNFDPSKHPKKSVFLHSFFRSGSTYLFKKIRWRSGWTAYYEPLHEDLALFSLDGLGDAKKRHSNSKFRHQADGADGERWLFAEYEPLMNEGINGVRGFDRRLTYGHDFEGSDELLTKYVQTLKDSAQTENVFFQFNRTALQTKKYVELFPDDLHLYLERDRRDIWGSYLSFKNEGVHGFLRNNLSVLGFNSSSPLVQALAQHLPVAAVPFHFFFHSSFGELYQHYTLDQHYLIHSTFWLYAGELARRAGCRVVDLSALADDRLLRLEFEAQLALAGVPLFLEDIKLRRYKENELQLSTKALGAIDEVAAQIVQAVLGGGSYAPSEAAISIFPSPPAQELTRLSERGLELSSREFRNHQGEIRKLSAEISQLGPLHRIEFGRDYDASALSELGIVSMRFHPLEARHIWVDGRFGVLRFRLPIAQAFDFTLYAHVHPLMAERSRATKVLVNGEILEERLFSSTRQSHHFHVPKDFLTEDGVTEIALVTPRCFEGKRCRSRNMSLSLSKFSLKLL